MSTILNARSPYFKKYTDATKTMISATIELYIWNGLLSSPPTEVTYTVTKTPLSNQQGNYVVTEISELIRDYLYTEFYNDAQDAVWVKVDSSIDYGEASPVLSSDTFLAFDGFGYFEEGANPRQSTDPTQTSYTPMVLQTNMTVYFVRGRDIKIPYFSETVPTVTTDIIDGKWNGNEEFWSVEDQNWNDVTTSIITSDSSDSADKIQYLILTSEFAETGDEITFTSTVGNSQVQTIKLVEICEPKYDKYRSVFYNKFGALQSFWFTHKSKLKTNTKSDKYNSNLIDASGSSVTYDTTRHNVKRFRVVANQSITVNTALLDDTQNEPLEELFMSEQVWLEKTEGGALPVILKTQNVTRKTGVNDKIIQYSVDFDFAYNKINDIR